MLHTVKNLFHTRWLRNGTAIATVTILALFFGVPAGKATSRTQDQIEAVVTAAVRAVMREHAVPGMAVGIAVQGKNYLFYYGAASTQTAKLVDENTIFEIGSVSKLFTGTLGGYAQASGFLSLSDMTSKHLPELSGTSFDQISLASLGTYTAGGLPLQFPESVDKQSAMLDYFRTWPSACPPETQRLYSNPSIGLFGHAIAQAMGADFEELQEKILFPAFGLKHSYITVPQAEMDNYAHGYTKDDEQIRMSPGMFAAQAYGVKTTAADLLRFVAAHGNSSHLEKTVQQAIHLSQTGYYSVNAMTQGLGWEMYAYPPDREMMIAQSDPLTFDLQPVTAPSPAQPDMFMHKTGSTSGFGAYVLLIPSKETAIVLLANKNYPNPVRIKTAARILALLVSP